MLSESQPSLPLTVFVGGVGELFQGDLDFGRLAVERLLEDQQEHGPGGPNMVIEELHYGAVAVTQRITELQPSAMILVGAVDRARPVGPVYRTLVEPPELSADDLQTAVGDAVTGYIAVDLVIEVATGLGALPGRTISFEIEPEWVGPGEGLSESASRCLEQVLAMVRREAALVPLMELAAELRSRHFEDKLEPSAAREAMIGLLDDLVLLEHEGRWGHVFARRDDVRLAVTEGRTSESMDQQDWAQWWAMIEELDRLQVLEAV